MGSSAVLFYGAYFGEHVDRPRFFEANFPLVVDEYLPWSVAAAGYVPFGARRKWRRMDPFGRPEPLDCCEGNIYTPIRVPLRMVSRMRRARGPWGLTPARWRR